MIDENYIPSVKALLAQKYQRELISLILFGSMLDYDENGNSSTDIDLIIVLKDSCPKNTRLELYSDLLGIQQKYGMYRSGFKDIFVTGLQNATGMFINAFICSYSDIQNQIFHKTFNVNKIFAFFLAPQNSVWISLKQRHRVIMGTDIFEQWEENLSVSNLDVIRSFMMNILLSMGALCLTVIGFDMSHFSMEAVKWSLFTWKNRKQLSSTKLHTLCKLYGSKATILENRTLSVFLEYRNTMRPNPYLLMLAPFFIFKLHNNLRNERSEKAIN